MKRAFVQPRRAAERLSGSLYVDRNRKVGNSVFLAGSGRSGTTWLSEIINHDNEYRYIFEPFYPDKVGVCKNFRRKQYLRPEDHREEYLKPAQAILSGRIRSLWADRFNKKFLVRRRLIKDIRANLLLGWLHAHFPEMPLILMLRHPCAVTSSRLTLGWKDILNETLTQRQLLEDFLAPLEAEIREARGDFERSVFLWCIENYVPLKQLGHENLLLVFYENLCVEPEREVRRLFSFLGKDFDENVLGGLYRPSRLSRRGSAANLGERAVDSWKKFVSEDHVQRATEIMALFGLDSIYGRDPMPNHRAAYGMLGEGNVKSAPNNER